MVDDEELRKLRFILNRKRGKISYYLSYIFYKLFSHIYNKKNKKRERYVNINGRTLPNFFCDNKIRSTKYSILTFIPLFLFYQFSDFLNLFYLCVSLLQIIPIFNTGYVFTFVAPLIFIIFISLINEVVDDFKRFIKDLENNNEIYYTLVQNGNLEKIYSKDIKVGDIILIKSKQRVPADCILLKNLNKNEEYTFKNEEKKSFCNIKLNKNTNVYNKINKNYYHFNKNIDNELIDERYNETNNNYSENSNNLLFSENEKSQKEIKQNAYFLNDENESINKNDINNVKFNNNFQIKKKQKRKKKSNKNSNKKNNSKSSNETENYTYVKTDKIDGETDWKIKYPISIFQNFKKLKDFFSVDILFILEQPKNDIYNIEGSYVVFKYNPYGKFKTIENDGDNVNNNQTLNYSFDLIEDEEEEEEDEEDKDEDEEYENEEDYDYDEDNLYEYEEGKEMDNEKKQMLEKGYIDLEETRENDIDYIYNKKEKKNKEMVVFSDVANEVDKNINLECFNTENKEKNSNYENQRNIRTVYNSKDNFNFYNINYRKKLNYDNFILFNSVITSSDVICLVIYTGSDTRVNMSTQISKIKRGTIDKKLNLITFCLFIILAIFSMYMCSIKLNNLWYLNFIRFVLLFSSVIPISLSVNLNIAKIYYTLLIQKDKEIETTIIKNNAIIENFGDIDYIFTDKTGTLTENVMILKVIHTGIDVIYAENDKNMSHDSIDNKTKESYTKNILSYNLDVLHNEEDIDDSALHLSSNYSKYDNRNKNYKNKELISFNYELKDKNQNDIAKLSHLSKKINKNNIGDIENENYSEYNRENYSYINYRDSNLKYLKQNYELNQTNVPKRKDTLSNNIATKLNKKKKVEKMVDEFLKYKTDFIDYYDDNIDDIEYLKRHKVFQTFLSFLICNNIRTLTKESNNKEKEELKRKKEKKDKDLQKNLYYILKVNRKNKNEVKMSKKEKTLRSNAFGDKNNNFPSNISENSENFSHSDVSYQCSSPDELAFLKYATNCGFILKKKTANKIEIKYKNVILEYEILLHIPFSSETKRMSIFVRNLKNRKIYFFIKGADNILIRKCHEKYKTFIYEESDHLSNLGLRVLVHGILNIEEQFFQNFFNLYNKNKDIKGKMENVLECVEQNIKVLAITGVEDKLQKGVGKTIEMLYNSGIKVWVLTGDKIETAICICKNANIKKKKNNIYIFRHENINSTASLIREFNSILSNIESYVLFFDNIIIQNCIKYIPNAFVDFAVNARAVVCCRCSPIEKKEIAVLIKTIKKKKVLCIGDGGNDVAMIQSADIGIGVLGREGKQVVHDSDIIVSKFKNIKKLILYYGNNTFLQTSSLCSFLIHRGFILTYLQFIYSYIFFCIPVSIFQGWLQIGYTTYYTTAPFLSLLLDIKIKKNLIYLYPEIYKNKKHKRKLDLKSFFIIVWISIFQGTVVMLGALKLFNDNYNNLINISFSSLIVLEIMNIHLEVESWHPLMISANICSFIVYIFSMFILRNYFDIMQIMSVIFWYKVILIVLFAWLPFYIIKKIKNIITPSQFFKLA